MCRSIQRYDIMLQRQDILKIPTPHPSSITYNEYLYNIVMNKSAPSWTISEEKTNIVNRNDNNNSNNEKGGAKTSGNKNLD